MLARFFRVALVLKAVGIYISLKEPRMSTFTVTYDPFQKLCATKQHSNTVTTPTENYKTAAALLKELRSKALGWLSMCPDLNTTEAPTFDISHANLFFVTHLCKCTHIHD